MFTIPYADYCSCNLWDHGKLIYKFTKGKKTDFDALMVADYEPHYGDVYDDNKVVAILAKNPCSLIWLLCLLQLLFRVSIHYDEIVPDYFHSTSSL
jgi:hypothetical protein